MRTNAWMKGGSRLEGFGFTITMLFFGAGFSQIIVFLVAMLILATAS